MWNSFFFMCTWYSFFFFKQKTAYEMRISDWSSDVCSSDLAPTRQQEDAAIAGHRQASERYGDDPALRHRDDAGGTQVQQTLDPAALYQAQMAMRDGLPQATTPAPLNPKRFADMGERHLKQMDTDRGATAAAVEATQPAE